MVHFRAEGKINEPKLTLSSSWAPPPPSQIVSQLSLLPEHASTTFCLLCSLVFLLCENNTRKVWTLPNELHSVSDPMTRLSCCDPGLARHYLTRPGDLRASTWCDSHSFIHSTNIYPASVAPHSRNKTNKPLLLHGVDSMGGDRT